MGTTVSSGAADQAAPIRLSQDEARQFLVSRHGLAQPRSLPARPDSVLKVVDRTGMLQFDPLEVPGARNHDLVLHSRIDGYRREWTDEWLYGPDRRLFEIYNKSLNIIPIGELPHHRVSWDRHAAHYNDGILREHADVAHNILQRIGAEGPLTTAAFAEHGKSIDWWWAPTRVARAVLEALFVVGRVGISRRDGNRRYYDLVERLVPEELLKRRETAEDGHLHRMLSRYRAVGLTWPSAPPELMMSAGKVDERVRRTRRPRRARRSASGGSGGPEGDALRAYHRPSSCFESPGPPSEIRPTSPAWPSSRRSIR